MDTELEVHANSLVKKIARYKKLPTNVLLTIFLRGDEKRGTEPVKQREVVRQLISRGWHPLLMTMDDVNEQMPHNSPELTEAREKLVTQKLEAARAENGNANFNEKAYKVMVAARRVPSPVLFDWFFGPELSPHHKRAACAELLNRGYPVLMMTREEVPPNAPHLAPWLKAVRVLTRAAKCGW